MSLNGTIETFALPDVLALLSATKKTGELKVNGGRGEARVWLDKGDMVGADVPRATTFVDALFEMLRLTSGEFAFENDRLPASPSGPMAVEALLGEAQSRLGEWKSIEAVVPSLACAVTLAAEVSGAQVSITAEQWRTLVAVAMNPDVEGVMGALGLGEFDSCRMLKDLVQIGLVTVDDAPPAPAEAPAPAPAAEPVATVEEPDPEHHSFQTPVRAPAAFKPPVPDRPGLQPPAPSTTPPRRVSGSTLVAAARSQGSGGDEPQAPVRSSAASTRPETGTGIATKTAASTRSETGTGTDAATKAAASTRPETETGAGTDAAARPAAAGTAKSPANAAAPTPRPERDGSDPDPAELVHQLAQLQSDSPPPPRRPAGGAPAPAGTSTSSPGTPETDDDEAPHDGPAKGEEPLNRGLLLKFLNSVRS